MRAARSRSRVYGDRCFAMPPPGPPIKLGPGRRLLVLGYVSGIKVLLSARGVCLLAHGLAGWVCSRWLAGGCAGLRVCDGRQGACRPLLG